MRCSLKKKNTYKIQSLHISQHRFKFKIGKINAKKKMEDYIFKFFC